MNHRISLALVCSLVASSAAAPDAGSFTRLSPTDPADAIATFDLDPQFRAELVAAEPLIADPVAMTYDENGTLFVVEMRDYSERREERLGRVSRLEDRDHDGRMDHATVFASDLPWPTGIIGYDGGVFVVASPDLWFLKDTDGDGVADERRVVLTGFSELAPRPNVQQLPNSLRWGADQRIHIAEGGNGSRIRRPDQSAGDGLLLRGRDLSFDPRTLELRAENGGGQNGMAFDDFGRKFNSSNSRHLMQVAYLQSPDTKEGLPFPSPTADIAVDGPAAPVFRRSPDEAWRVARTRWRVAGLVEGPIEGGGTPSGYFTGATGVQIYRGDLFPSEYVGSAYIADCGSNLLHRKRLRPDGLLMSGGRFAEDSGREFLASTDNWFRPVQLENGPDGAFYALDLYREIIEHPWSLPPGIKEHLDLNHGNDRGRIWRIVPKDASPRRTVALGKLTNTELIKTLGHPNGWHRDTAARLLFQRHDPATVAPLQASAIDSANQFVRLGALSLLSAFGRLEESTLVAALTDAEPMVRLRALKLARVRITPDHWLTPPLLDRLRELTGDTSAEVRFSVALLLGDHPIDQELAFQSWNRLAPAAGNDPFQQRAVVRFMAPHAPAAVATFVLQSTNAAARTLKLDLIQVATRKSSPKMVTDWFAAAASSVEENRASLLVMLAAGVGREAQMVTRLQLAQGVKEQLAEALSNFFSDPQPDNRGDWLNPAFSLLEPDQVKRAMLPVLTTGNSSGEIDAAVLVLLRLKTGGVYGELLDRWTVLPAVSRQRLLADALNQPTYLAAVLEHAAADADFRTQLNPTLVTVARGHKDAALRSRAIAIFGDATDASIAQRQQALAGALSLPGDAVRGRVIFQNRCATCHRAHEEGFALGPDLLTVAGAGRETLLLNIIDPNREVAPRFESWTVTLRDGEEATGLLMNQDNGRVILRAAANVETIILSENVSAIAATGKSLMPPGLDDGMTAEQMADLLRFIESLALR